MPQLYATILTILFTLAISGCSDEPPAWRPPPDIAVETPQESARSESSDVLASVPSEPEQVVEAPPDPYAGWESWCAPAEEDAEYCETDADCPQDPFHPGRSMRCVRPWWSAKEGLDVRECHPARPTRKERNWRRDRLETVVADRCRSRKGCDQAALSAILRLEALKESSYRPWARHRLNADLTANATAYWRMVPAYGHEMDGRQLVIKEDGNPHYKFHLRWRTGLGYYGMNAAGFAWEWERDAPPEVLCREEIATEVWLRRARRVHRKLTAGVDCDRDAANGREFHGSATDGGVSWYDIHNGVNAGKLCPASKERQAMFVRRAEREGLDPWASLSIDDLGVPVDRETQTEWLGQIAAKLDRIEPPW